ncbi:MAG: hypothetical protein HPY79_12130 [Bacteroidales bacterium]|nr:hypothetical protein [Bacteroidales bacterium]
MTAEDLYLWLYYQKNILLHEIQRFAKNSKEYSEVCAYINAINETLNYIDKHNLKVK